MVKRIITALILAGIAIPCVAMQGVAFDILVLAFMLVAIYETIHLFHGQWHIASRIVMALAIAGACIAPYLEFSLMILAIVSALVMIFDANVKPSQIGITVLNGIIFTLAIGTITFFGDGTMYGVGGFMYFFIFLASLLCDTGAYFVGILCGKHKLCERLSPKKTIEGAIGGFVVGCGGSLLFGYIASQISGIAFNWDMFVLLSVVLPLLSMIGDLYFSAIKREVGIKDFGTIFPGHGGVLDRIDGLLFALGASAPLVMGYLMLLL